LANPLTAKFGIVHGQAVGLMLPHVIRFNGQDANCQQAYAQLLSHCDVFGSAGNDTVENAAETLADLVTRFVQAAGLHVRLADLNVSEDSFAAMAADAAQQWTGTFNPVPVDVKSLLQLYRNAA